MKDIMKTAKSLEESRLLVYAHKAIKNKTKEWKDGFLDVLLGKLAANELRYMSSGEAKIPARKVIRASEEAFRADRIITAA